MLFLSFSTNIIVHTHEHGQQFGTFQSDSESLVTHRVDYSITNGTDSLGGFMVFPIGPYSQSEANPYLSQYGLQARIINSAGYYFQNFWVDLYNKEILTTVNNGYINKVSNVPIVALDTDIPQIKEQADQILFIICRAILALLLSITFTIMLNNISQRFGELPGLFTFSLLCSSTWLILFAQNLYWVTFLLFLPFMIGWLLYPELKVRKKMWIFNAIICVLVLLKSLCGYEYITNVILSVTIPILFYDLTEGYDIKQVVKDSLIPVLSGMSGFFTALGVHTYALYQYYGSLPSATNVILSRASARTISDPVTTTKFVTDLFNRFFVYSGDTTSNILYLMENRLIYEARGVITIPWTGINIPLIVIEGLVLLICIHEIRNTIKGVGNKSLYIVSLTTIAAYIVANSWAILAIGHMKEHSHMNEIVFYIPFLIIAYLLISIFITNRLLHKKIENATA